MRTTIFPGAPGGARPRGALLLAAAVTIALPLAESTAEAQPLVYYGGGVISNVQIVQVAWTPEVSADRKDKLSDFYKTILGTTYLDWFQEYDTIGLLGVDGLPGSDDPQALVCDAKTRSCRGCQSNDECQSGVCDTTTDSQAGQCVECLTDAECGAEEACEAHACVDKPATTTDTSGDADSDGGCAMGRGAGESSEHGWMFGALGGLAAAWTRLKKRSAGRPPRARGVL